MGRTEPSLGRPPAGFRRDARAKKAKATVNKVIPSLLSAHPRARKGIESAELIVNPPPTRSRDDDNNGKKGAASSPQRVSKSELGTGSGEGRAGGMRITMRLADTLVVAHSLLSPSSSLPITNEEKKKKMKMKPDLTNREARVGILNMASPLSPGGGFLNGAAAQEESLCMRTTLLPSLRDEFYRLPQLGAVYTPDVLVFRDEKDGVAAEDLHKMDRWFVNCISAAMLRIPETQEVEVEVESQVMGETEQQQSGGDDDDNDDEDEDGNDASEGPLVGRRKMYADPKDRELVIRKMKVVLRIAQAKGIRKLVLGSWGCGAYGNPVEEIAAAWKKVLLGSKKEGKGNGRGKKSGKQKETWVGVEEVVFAIKGGGIAERFERAFGNGLVREEDAGNQGVGDAGSQGHDDLEKMRLRELREKIQQLELQVQQARTPQLRSGLISVLAGLRSQLPEDRGSSNEHGSPSRGDRDYGEGEDEENAEISETASESDN